MSFTSATEHDFTVFDATLSLTLHTATASRTISAALAGPVERAALERLSQQFGLESTYRSFSLPSVQLGPVQPAVGDTLDLADGTRWRIVAAQQATAQTRWTIHAILTR